MARIMGAKKVMSNFTEREISRHKGIRCAILLQILADVGTVEVYKIKRERSKPECLAHWEELCKESGIEFKLFLNELDRKIERKLKWG